jgi:hypothetical protein
MKIEIQDQSTPQIGIWLFATNRVEFIEGEFTVVDKKSFISEWREYDLY